MPVNRGPGVRQIGAIGTTPKEHRLALAGQYAENAPGVPRSGLLVQAATNVVSPTAATGTMTYLVSEVAAVIGRGVGDGVYTPTTVGATIANRTVNTAASPASGSRWDLVWIKQNDQEKGDANNEAILGVTSGTAAASPVRPTGSVPAGAMVLSEHQIFSGTATTTAAPNTTTQLWRHTAARGAPFTIRTPTERAEVTAPALGQQITRPLAGLQISEQWNGAGWDHFGHAEWTFNQANPGFSSAILFGPGTLTNDAAVSTDAGFVTAVGETLVIRDTGLYDIVLTGAWQKPPTGRAFSQIENATSGVTYRVSASVGEDLCMVSLAGVRLAAGAILKPVTLVTFGAGSNVWSGRISITRAG